jgi:hypothetical protein
MNIIVHIERLILDGLPLKGSDGPIVRAALETKLASLLNQQGLAGMSADAVPNLTARPIQIAREAQPARLGYQVAQAIHQAFGAESATRPETRRLSNSNGAPSL